MNVEFVIALVPAAVAWATARWLPSHRRLLTQARDDLSLAEQFGRGPVANELRRRAGEAVTEGLKLRDSNDVGRNLALFAGIGVLGTIGLPAYWRALPESIEGWRGLPMLIMWGVYALFALAAFIGWIGWLVKRPR